MTAPIKILLGSISVVIAVFAFVPYLKDTIAKRNTPHPFTWLIWGMTCTIIFLAQVTQRGGAGSWSNGLIGLFCFVIFVFSLRGARRQSGFPATDWFALSAACIAIVLWVLTDDPTGAVVLVTLADSIGYLPTFRKSTSRPAEESVSFYALIAMSDMLAILALENYTLSTWLYPVVMMVMGGSLALYLLRRRAQPRSVSGTENRLY